MDGPGGEPIELVLLNIPGSSAVTRDDELFFDLVGALRPTGIRAGPAQIVETTQADATNDRRSRGSVIGPCPCRNCWANPKAKHQRYNARSSAPAAQGLMGKI